MKFKLLLATTMSLVFLVQLAYGQTTTYTGTVRSAETNETLPGATVVLKGKATGVATDINGRFSIDATAGETVVVSFIGMKPKEVVLASNTNLDISLAAGVLMDEVVVTALGISRETKALGYSVESVDGREIQESGEMNPVTGMAARMSGIQVTNSSGAAGAASYIKIRGNATFSSNDNQPLFVVDGVPISNNQNRTQDLRDGVSLSNRAIDINPADIESVSVLKGGAAAALYGTRGANGVILITTKRGAYGQKMAVDFTSSYELMQVNKLPDLQTRYGQGLGSDGIGTSSPFSWGPDLNALGIPSYDNTENFFQNGSRFNNSLTISGGSDRANMIFSVADSRESGVIPLNDFSRTSLRFTSKAKVSERLTVTGSLSYTNSGGRRIQQGSNTSGLMLGLLRTTPSFDNSNGATDPEDPSAFLNPDGTQRSYRGITGYDNPFWTINRNPFEDDVNRLFGYFMPEFKVNEWLNLTYRGGIDTYSDRRTQIISKGSNTSPAGRLIEDQWNWTEINHDFMANFNKTWDRIGLSGLVGYNVNQRDLNNTYVQGDGFALDNFFNISNASSVISTVDVDRRRLTGLYAEATLSLDNAIYLTLGARRDQSSTFGDVQTGIFYPSVSGSVVFTDLIESLKDNDVLSFGKIRASWAKVGIEPGFGTNRTYYSQTDVLSGWVNGTQFPFLGQTGFTYGNTAGNDELSPEFTETFEVGFDLRFLQDRIGVDFTYYNQQSKDLIVEVPVAGSSGITNQWQNIGVMENKGIEISLNADVIRKTDFTWNLGGVFTRNRNTVKELAPGVDVIDLPWGFFGANQRLVVGEAYGTLYGDDWERDANGNALVDANGYPVYSPVEVAVGDPNPDFLMGINTTVTYKNWSFYMLWDIRQGGDIWNGTRGALDYFGTSGETADGRGESFVWEDVVQGNSGVYAPNTIINGQDVSGQANTTSIPRDENSHVFGPLSGFTGASRPYIEDGSWVRMRQVTLTYRFNPTVFENTFIKGMTLSFTGRNLLLFTDYSGIDPETNLSGATNSQGADYFNMPATRGYIFTLNANF